MKKRTFKFIVSGKWYIDAETYEEALTIFYKGRWLRHFDSSRQRVEEVDPDTFKPLQQKKWFLCLAGWKQCKPVGRGATPE